MRELDISSWKRKEHFDFFSKFDDPFFGVVLEVDCNRALEFTQEHNYSFFGFYLHKAMVAAHEIEEFKYRIVNGKVVVFDEINASSTIGREDDTFGFSLIPYHAEFDDFYIEFKEEVTNVQNTSGLNLTEEGNRKDLISFG